MGRKRTLAKSLVLPITFALFASVGFSQEWVDRSTNISFQTGNVYFSGRWTPERGLHVKVSTPDRTQSAVIEISGTESKIALTPEHAFPRSVTEGSQFNLAALPSNTLASAALVLKFRQEIWALYVENRPVAVFPAPFFPPAILSQPQKELPSEDKRQVKLQQTADIFFHDDFMVPEETQEDAKLLQWDKLSGSWLLHTAQDSAIEGSYLGSRAKKALKPAYSSNFYSLKGKGTNAVIAAGYDFYDSYSVQAAVQVEAGEMGIVFYLQEESGGYHAFTAWMEEDSDEVVLALWKVASTNKPQREILDAVSTRITPGQWVLLRARTFQNRIQCYMDSIKVLDVPAELSAGGRFGLYVNSDWGIRFDDVAAESNHDLDFLGISDIRRHVVAENGGFFPKRRFFNLFAPREPANYLKPRESDKSQWLVVGSTAHAGHVFSADFVPEQFDTPWCAGLLVGYQGTNRPYLRFVCRRAGGKEEFSLEKATDGAGETLEKISLSTAKAASLPVTLMCDATNERELRLYRDNELVLVRNLPTQPQGASGLYVGPQTQVRISNLAYQFERENLYRNKFVENKIYIEDPFMRHWSSPEGQWLEETNGMAWHQGDFFGRFVIRLPYVTNSEIHVGIEEGQTNGAYVVTVDPNAVNLRPGPIFRPMKPLATVAVDRFLKPPPATNWITLHYEGYWLWLTDKGDTVLFKHQLEQPLKGRKARLKGFTTDQLKLSHVERFNVRDYLFTESLHDWTINGGRWEVINRFQCSPQWSHMNGEATNGFAAIWTKYLYKGDFCMELYAGTRMGWYERCGDFNMTILDPRTTPSEGYTATCTGWDYDRSQLYSRLYRNGDIIAQTDKYLVPRHREGNRRLGYVPLVRLGGMRDVHGAWYYIKLRRIGKRLEFHFDNELVFATEDPNPLGEGSAGIWTYLTSMMVARVKIAAESIRPKPFPFSSTLVLLPDLRRLEIEEEAPSFADILKDGRPLENMNPTQWDMDDPVGYSHLTWHDIPGKSPYFVTENALGSGAMFVQCKLPPSPYPDVAGWRFLVKRTPGAQFNLHYSLGRKNEKGEYVAERQFFHRITGPTFSLGAFKMSGQSTVPASSTNGDWHASGPWNPVEVWAATEGLSGYAKNSNILLRVEGFGNLQQSYEAEGLTGNAPGDGYAVRDFSEIRFSPPVLTQAANVPPPKRFSLFDAKTDKPLIASTNLADVQSWIRRTSTNGIVTSTFLVERTNGISENTLSWLGLPAEPAFSFTWSEKYPNAVVLRPGATYPDRRLAFALLSMGNTLVPLTTDPLSGDRFAVVPRRFEFGEPTTNAVSVMVSVDGKITTFDLPWKNNPLREPPVLLRIEGPSPLCEGFERRELLDPLTPDAARMKIGKFDPEQGSYLEVFNTELGQRIRTGFSAPLTLARYPIVQFRYRAVEMAFVSLSLGDTYYVRVNEDYPNAKPVRNSQPLRRDGQWHTWQGVVSDSMADRPFNSNLMSVPSLTLASYHSIDQTGRYTQWNLDDVVVGPAVSTPEQLAFTPYYFDFGGVQAVYMTVRNGVESYPDLPREAAPSLKWREIPNMTRAIPDIAGLTNGICHILLKARNKRGDESLVTDIPFMLDKQPLETAYEMEKTSDPQANGTLLRVNFTNAGKGAPLDIESMKLRWNDKDVSVPSLCSSFSHSPERDSFALNWPYIFREQLNQSTQGMPFKIVVANIRDGASNSAPDVMVPMSIDYTKDHLSPTVLQTGYPTNIFWCTPWEVGSENTLHFTTTGPGILSLTLIRETNDTPPYLSAVIATNGGSIWRSFESKPWSIAAHPYLSFRIRRPNMPPDDPTRIDMVIESTLGVNSIANVLSLTHTATGKTAVVLSDPIVWQSNTWQSLTFDMPEILKDQYPPEQLKDVKIKVLRFTQRPNTTTNTLHLQNFYVYAPWKSVDRVKLNAYDASGMDSPTWTCETAAKGTALIPASLPVQDENTGWVALRARDRAGNLSRPLWAPLFSTNVPSETAGTP